MFTAIAIIRNQGTYPILQIDFKTGNLTVLTQNGKEISYGFQDVIEVEIEHEVPFLLIPKRGTE